MNAHAVASKETSDRLRAQSERQLTAEEARTWLSAPIDDSERADVLSLVSWFCRRYPTPAERLAYVRRAYARWQRVHESTLK
jgi:hypothetical protein